MKDSSLETWEKRPNLTAFLFFSGLVILFYHQVVFGNSIFVFVDASRFFYPMWKWGADVLKQGFIPLWNPDAQFGTPYLADPQMAYAYPPVPLLYSFLSPVNAFAWLIILQHLWALLGFWFFARGQGFSSKASLLGSLVFGFSLNVVCSSWTPVAMMTISWIPWVFLSVEKILQNQRGGLLCLSFAWAMQLAAGYPVLSYLTGLAVFFHLVWRTFWPVTPNVGAPPGGRPMGRAQGPAPTVFIVREFSLILLAGLIAVAYNLVWGLPFAELFTRSNYQNGATKFHDLNGLDLATILSPFIQGHPLRENYHGPHYWVSTYFFGRPALCLLLWGMATRLYQKTSWIIFLILLVLSLGANLGLGSLLKVILPGYSLVIHSGYWISLMLFWAAWMAVESADSFFKVKTSPPQIWLWVGIAAAIYAGSFLVKSPLPQAAFWLSFVLLGLAIMVPSITGRWGLLVLATGLSLGTAAFSLNILLDRSYYGEPPKVLGQLTKEGRLFFSPPMMKEAVLLKGDNMPAAYDMAKQKMYPDWPLTFGKEQAPIYNTLRLSDSFAWTFQAFQYSLKHSRSVLDYLNIRYLFGKNQFKDFRRAAGENDSVEVYENPTGLPKWFSVEMAVAASPAVEDDFLKADKDSMDYGKQCFVADTAKAGSYQPRQVAVQTHWPNRLAFIASGRGKALVISSETAYPGWRAWVEGKGKAIEQINHAFRGVVLEEGENRVVLNFEPISFRLGLFCSLLVCGLWSGLLIRKVRA